MKATRFIFTVAFLFSFIFTLPNAAHAGKDDGCIQKEVVEAKEVPNPRDPRVFWKIAVWNTCPYPVTASFRLSPGKNATISSASKFTLAPGGKDREHIVVEKLKRPAPPVWELKWSAVSAAPAPAVAPPPPGKMFPNKIACVAAKGLPWCNANKASWR